MSILLDTVTISNFRRYQKADPNVLRWQESLKPGPVFLSVVTLNEIRFGIRKVERSDQVFASDLSRWYQNIVAASETYQLILVDRSIAEVAADFRHQFKMSYNDSFIGATAEVHGLTLATRNVADFQDCGIPMINPWAFGSDEFHHPSRS